MFSLTIRDHMMIAHSFRRDVRTGAAAARGDVRRRRDLQARRPGPRQPGGRHRAGRRARAVLGELSYRNLDELSEFEGMNTSTEALAQVVVERLAARIRAGDFGDSARELSWIAATLHESHIASATYERPL